MSNQTRATNPLGQKMGGVQLPVHIRQKCDVDNEVVNIRQTMGDEIVWYSESEYDFTVEFAFTPFKDRTFVVPAGGSVCSGPVLPDAPVTLYRYNILNVALAMSADPDVNVKH